MLILYRPSILPISYQRGVFLLVSTTEQIENAISWHHSCQSGLTCAARRQAQRQGKGQAAKDTQNRNKITPSTPSKPPKTGKRKVHVSGFPSTFTQQSKKCFRAHSRAHSGPSKRHPKRAPKARKRRPKSSKISLSPDM